MAAFGPKAVAGDRPAHTPCALPYRPQPGIPVINGHELHDRATYAQRSASDVTATNTRPRHSLGDAGCPCDSLLQPRVRSDDMPENASPNRYGSGWTCDRGYRKVDGICNVVKVPANAYPTDTSYGRGWRCSWGYRESGESCLAVKPPANAHLSSPHGDTWKCDRGFRKSDAKCVAINVPNNGYLSNAAFGAGPRFHDHKVTGEIIEEKWESGESAANQIRQAEEEWLLAKAREFGVDVRIRDVQNAHKYDRGELARALLRFLKSTKIEVPQVTGISNPFLVSLQKGDVENFGSHFSDDPQAWGSIGDEKKRWQEFTEFAGYFKCGSCEHTKFKRPKVGMTKAVCAKCEHPFSFQAMEEFPVTAS